MTIELRRAAKKSMSMYVSIAAKLKEVVHVINEYGVLLCTLDGTNEIVLVSDCKNMLDMFAGQDIEYPIRFKNSISFSHGCVMTEAVIENGKFSCKLVKPEQ